MVLTPLLPLPLDLLPVMESFSCQKATTQILLGREVSVKGYLEQIDPWACLGGTVLTTLIDAGRHSQKWAAPFPP